MADAFTRLVMIEYLIFIIYLFVTTPIHEVGHMVAFRHYGIKSIIGFGSNSKNKCLAYCKPLLWIDSIPLIEDRRKDAVVAFAGGGASIIFCLCMYVMFPLNAFLFVALWEGLYGLTEIQDGWNATKRLNQGIFDNPWYMEDKEEHKLFNEELSKYEGETIIVPWARALLRLEGFDLKEFE